MSSPLLTFAFKEHIFHLLEEDDLTRNAFYLQHLPADEVECILKIKDDLVLSGLPFFRSVFETLCQKSLPLDHLMECEGKTFSKSEKSELRFKLPFQVALTGERLALNLLQRSSSISTFTAQFKNKIGDRKIVLLDTRKTTPGLRWLEKYAVRVGGGMNHRFGQADVWMIKDNHKVFWKGLEGAVKFFRSLGDFYRPIVAEIHDLKELKEGLDLGLQHFLLDNFSPEQVKLAISLKRSGVTFEVSGGINMQNIRNYLLDGVDAISIGGLTYAAPPVDLSLKFHR